MKKYNLFHRISVSSILFMCMLIACQSAQAQASSTQRSMLRMISAQDKIVAARIADAYTFCVGQSIVKHWQVPQETGLGIVTRVLLEIAMNGQITKVTVLESSGFEEFDASVIAAIKKIAKVIPPPSPQLQEIILGFNKR